MDRFEQLWAPWRLTYVSGADDPPVEPRPQPPLLPDADASCFLCRAAVDVPSAESLVVERTEQSLVILNRYPYSNGHLLIAPRWHKPRLDLLSPEEQLDQQRLIARYIQRLESCIRAEGFNVGLNLGRVAGAGVPGHLHWHLVPRWNGDTNFMPTIAGAKVIPQSLDAVWELLNGC